MAKIFKRLSLSLLAFGMMVTNADDTSSQTNRVLVDLSAGINKFDSSSRLSKKNTPFYGLRATIYDSVVDKYGFQLAYSGAYGVDYKYIAFDEAKESDVHRVLANLVIDGDEDLDITPYLIMGAGYEYLSDEIKGEVSQGIADIGIGFRYSFDYGLYSALELQAIGKFDSKDIDYGAKFLLGYNFAYHGGINASESNFAKANRKIDIVKVKPQTPRTIINEIEVDSQEEAEKLANSSVTNEVIIQSSQNQDKSQTFDNSYYIQVAAYKSTKTYPTVKKIKALGFENVQVKDEESRIGLLHKVLVGPYASKNEAKRDLRRLKRVNKKAYIIKG